jgi:ribosomal protein L37AE/L43A
MRVTSRTMSRPNRIVCLACGSGELQLRGLEPARCDVCGLSVEDAMFRTIQQIAALPDALGSHACECGHPEMRRLPDGVFHCPSCSSEIYPIKERRSIESRNERRVRRGPS